ncbi:MAG: methyltransferase domain-containing protein [Bacteroidetes bacterium]|nr:methyltransferase domain-containing protein [Bacteroidota bacterium]MDA1121186.1 methyltransferase domain-containing protein [Bacteroidota bacterium]
MQPSEHSLETKPLLKRLAYVDSPAIKLNSVQKLAKSQLEEKLRSGKYSLEKINECEVCDSREFQLISERDRYGIFHSVFICKGCGLVTSNPRMDENSLNHFYKEEYRPLYIGSETPKHDFFEGQLFKGQRIYNFLMKHHHIKSPSQLVLEVGCGAGGILKYFKNQGHEVIGVDLGAEYINYGVKEHDLDLRVGNLKSLKLDSKPDIVIYSHVLEHLTSPVEELSGLRNLISEQTIIYIEVPGIFNLNKDYRWDFLRYLQNSHNYYFSLNSLSNILTKSAFRVIMGDETIRIVAVMDERKSTQPKNEYPVLIKYLKKMEWKRFFYVASIENCNGVIVKLILMILNFLGLRRVVKQAFNR